MWWMPSRFIAARRFGRRCTSNSIEDSCVVNYLYARKFPETGPFESSMTTLRALSLAALAVAALIVAAPAAHADVVWLCKPGLADNPCEIPQDTTVQEYGKPDRVLTPPTGERRIDCFYVSPTVSNQPTANATKARDPELVSIAKYQAARFSTQCRT